MIGKPEDKDCKADFQPISEPLLVNFKDDQNLMEYKERGNQIIREGDVCLVVYGGQSVFIDDNLNQGKEEALGMCDIGLPSSKTPY